MSPPELRLGGFPASGAWRCSRTRVWSWRRSFLDKPQAPSLALTGTTGKDALSYTR